MIQNFLMTVGVIAIVVTVCFCICVYKIFRLSEIGAV